MSTSGRPTRVVRCPTCSGPAAFIESNPWRPFCSERCRGHDLGAWATESYRVPAAAPAQEPEGGDEPPAAH